MDEMLNEVLAAVARRGLRPRGPDMPPIMVVSHERSGTHFTMNSLAACFGYVSVPWIDFDVDQVNINYHAPAMLRATLQALANLRAGNIVKSHHEFGFFAEALPAVPDLQVIYVHRRPAEVLPSFWRFLHTWPWREGPRTANVLEFIDAAPMGRLMRYQLHQHATMLDRWAAHVSGWVQAADRYPNVHLLRYADLDEQYERTIDELGKALKLTPIRRVRPLRGVGTVDAGPMPAPPAASPEERARVWRIALERRRELMLRLGYTSAPSLRLAS